MYSAEDYPALAQNSDLIFPTLMFDLLPVGVRGLIIAALIAAIMSSADSTLNSASTLVTMDFIKKLKPSVPNHRLVIAGRIVTFAFMTLAILWAPQIVKFPNIWTYLQQMLAYLAPPIVACFFAGVFWRRANGSGAIAALAVGHLAAAVFFILSLTGRIIVQTQTLTPEQAQMAAAGTPVIHFLYLAPILTAISLLAMVVAMQASGVLLQRSLPGDRHGQEESIQPGIIEPFTDVAPRGQQHTIILVRHLRELTRDGPVFLDSSSAAQRDQVLDMWPESTRQDCEVFLSFRQEQRRAPFFHSPQDIVADHPIAILICN
jgi:hypothetical protein